MPLTVAIRSDHFTGCSAQYGAPRAKRPATSLFCEPSAASALDSARIIAEQDGDLDLLGLERLDACALPRLHRNESGAAHPAARLETVDDELSRVDVDQPVVSHPSATEHIELRDG